MVDVNHMIAVGTVALSAAVGAGAWVVDVNSDIQTTKHSIKSSEQRFDRIERRLDSLDAKVANMDGKLDILISRVK